MKKALIVVATLILAMASVMFVACGGGIEGTYKIKSVTYGETTYTVGQEFDGQELKSDTFVVEVNKDGTFKFTAKYDVNGQTQTEEMTGTWKLKEGDVYEITLSYDEEHQDTFEATIKDGTLSFTQGNGQYSMEYVFKK